MATGSAATAWSSSSDVSRVSMVDVGREKGRVERQGFLCIPCAGHGTLWVTEGALDPCGQARVMAEGTVK